MTTKIAVETPKARCERLERERLALLTKVTAAKVEVAAKKSLVTPEIMGYLKRMVDADIKVLEAKGDKPYGQYYFPHFLVSKAYYAARALGVKFDLSKMSEKSLTLVAKAYELI